MTAYLLSAFGVIFLSVIMSYIVPEGKLNKTVNFILRIISITVLISPITGLFDISDETSYEVIDYEYVCEMLSDSQSRLLEQKISEELGFECDVVVAVVYENDCIAESGVTVTGDFDADTKYKILEYLKELGYININVNEQSD